MSRYVDGPTMDDAVPAEWAINMVASECFRRDRLLNGQGTYAAAKAAVAASGLEMLTSADIDRLASSIVSRPITFGPDPKGPTAAAITGVPAAKATTTVTKTATPDGFTLRIVRTS
jgi:hypothetical protein